MRHWSGVRCLGRTACAIVLTAVLSAAQAQTYGGGSGETVRDTRRDITPLPPLQASPDPTGLSATAVLPLLPLPVPDPVRTPPNDDDNTPDEVVALNIGPDDLAALQSEGFELLQVMPVDGFDSQMLRLRIPPDQPLFDAWRRVRALPTGEVSDFNHFYRAEQASCLGAECPERALVGWRVAPNRATACGRNVTIGMIDSGINNSHETFRGAALDVLRIAPGRMSPARSVHGTAVAALLVGDPASRSPGLVPGARLVAVDAFHSAGDDERTDLFTLVEALGHLAQEGVQVINLSLAGPHNLVLEHVIDRLTREMNIVVVAAVGNDGPTAGPAYPAGYPRVLAVTAVDRTGALYAQAIRGPHVDIAAPGVEVWTAASVKGARWKTGTSFAAPFVTAAAAILRETRPGLSVEEIAVELQRRARDLGPPGIDPEFGAGLLNLGPFCS